MSTAAALEAVAMQIRKTLTVPDPRNIDIRPTAKPTSAVTSQQFISVHSEGSRYGILNYAIDEYQLIGVTVSLMTPQDHIDYWGLKVRQPWQVSMDYAVRRIIAACHLSVQLFEDANNLLESGISSLFVEQLRVTRVESPIERGPEWWGTESTAKGRSNPYIGHSRTIHFEGLRRIQSMDSYT